MANTSPTDYKTLFLQAEEGRKEAEEEKKQEVKRRKEAEEGKKQEVKRRMDAEEQARKESERNQRTTFEELLRFCNILFPRSLKVQSVSDSTKGKIPLPTRKYCPIRLALWTDCSAQLQEIYSSVCNYLQPTTEARARLFTPLIVLEYNARRLGSNLISSEQGLEYYELTAVENHVCDIIAELCKIDAARDEFGLRDGIWFENHSNSLDNSDREVNANQPSDIHRPRPDHFCIHRVDNNTNTLLTTVEYKPPHKLPVEALHVGLHEMDLYKSMVLSNKIPTDDAEKLKYNTERLVCSAIVQEYHVMIQEGLEYSYVTNGIAHILLRVPYDDPSTLYYFLCDPNSEQSLQELGSSSIARVLCLCLMAFRSPPRDQEWRNTTQLHLPLWTTNFDHTRSQIPEKALEKIALHSDSTDSEHASSEPSSDYQPSSPSVESPTVGRRVPTRSQASCAPSDVQHRTPSPDSSSSDSNQPTARKRGFSQVISSPAAQRAARQREAKEDRGSYSKRSNAQFCTQRCLLGLRTGVDLDECCPNVKLHRRGQDIIKHPITSEGLISLLKAQLDENIDRCIPYGNCGAYGAPFKLVCANYGYVVFGKGTTSGLWKEVSREAQVYQILQKAQASAVPVFLGAIDLAKTYFLHGAGQIRHMLVMGWGGDSTATMELTPGLRRGIRKSIKDIKALGIVHEDLRFENILWNEELGRVLIIDFHRSTLRCRPFLKRQRSKRQLRTESVDAKRQLRTESGDAKRQLRTESGDIKRLHVS